MSKSQKPDKLKNYTQQGYNSVQSGTTPPADLTKQQKQEWNTGAADAARQLVD